MAGGVSSGGLFGGSPVCAARGAQPAGSGARIRAEPGHDRQDVPIFGTAGLSAQQTTGEAEAGPLMPVIDAILAADRSAPPKQRHTAKRIFERLRSEYQTQSPGDMCARSYYFLAA